MHPSHLKIESVTLKENIKQAWQDIMGPAICSHLTAPQVQQLTQRCQLSYTELAQHLLPIAAQYAVTPISQFKVGAIVIDEHHQFFMGANYERTQVPLNHTLHAEQATLFNAISHGAGKLQHLIVSAAPCGHCRQFIKEFSESSELTIQINAQQFDFEQLLPFAFGPDDLHVSASITSHTQSMSQTPEQLAHYSYAPYSGCLIGLKALQAGTPLAVSWYIENAAFNPSASPITLLLSQLQLHGYTLAQIDTIQIATNQSAISFKNELDSMKEHHPQIAFEMKQF
ncbi:cytidine deaminase [Celerinatantimonas sp. YJH-8]|uniref:cytidine deaminase n=1 Tax=Celerinatantimonas sp. YJH-8 TaxID=3228714 RepID=UPI0038CB002A